MDVIIVCTIFYNQNENEELSFYKGGSSIFFIASFKQLNCNFTVEWGKRRSPMI